MNDASTILLTAAGAVASWYFSRRYYLKSGTDLDVALRRLEGDHQMQLQALTAIGRMLEQSGMGHPTYNAAGNLTGIVVTGSARLTGSGGLTATGTATGPSQYDRQHEQPPSPEPEGDHA